MILSYTGWGLRRTILCGGTATPARRLAGARRLARRNSLKKDGTLDELERLVSWMRSMQDGDA